MKTKKIFFLILTTLSMAFVSCDKGYQVRVTNFYTEPMDSVIIGSNKLVFKDVALETTTDFYDLKKGKYSIEFITKTKKKFYSEINIPSKGSGNRTIQIDAIVQIHILEE